MTPDPGDAPHKSASGKPRSNQRACENARRERYFNAHGGPGGPAPPDRRRLRRFESAVIRLPRRARHGVNADFHLVSHAQEQRAGVLHAPLHVGHAERDDSRVLPVVVFHYRRQRDFVLGAVYGEHAVQSHVRRALQYHLAFHAVGAEDDFGIASALQNVHVHVPVARDAAARAARGVHHQLARGLAGGGVETDGAAFQQEASVNRVQRSGQREFHLGLRGIDLQDRLLGGNRGRRQHCGARQLH